jgi:hypothetical protein
MRSRLRCVGPQTCKVAAGEARHGHERMQRPERERLRPLHYLAFEVRRRLEADVDSDADVTPVAMARNGYLEPNRVHVTRKTRCVPVSPFSSTSRGSLNNDTSMLLSTS